MILNEVLFNISCNVMIVFVGNCMDNLSNDCLWCLVMKNVSEFMVIVLIIMKVREGFYWFVRLRKFCILVGLVILEIIKFRLKSRLVSSVVMVVMLVFN